MIFKFQKRALVHFAADPDEIHMTTRLAGRADPLLPFNRGSHPGDTMREGQPAASRRATAPATSGKRCWSASGLGAYMFVERRDEKVEDDKGARTVTRETLIFPRYHHWTPWAGW